MDQYSIEMTIEEAKECNRVKKGTSRNSRKSLRLLAEFEGRIEVGEMRKGKMKATERVKAKNIFHQGLPAPSKLSCVYIIAAVVAEMHSKYETL